MSEINSGSGSLTAEIRFWWPNRQTAILQAWLAEKGIWLEEEGERTDQYLFTASETVNLKQRDRKEWEIKRLLNDQLLPTPFAGQEGYEIWVKHELPSMATGGGRQVSIKKRRWLAFLDETGKPITPHGRPASGCQIEVSEVKPVGEQRVWTSFCLEAFGQPAALGELLRRATEKLGDLPCAGEIPLVANYAEWLSEEDYFGLD